MGTDAKPAGVMNSTVDPSTSGQRLQGSYNAIDLRMPSVRRNQDPHRLSVSEIDPHKKRKTIIQSRQARWHSDSSSLARRIVGTAHFSGVTALVSSTPR
jgi:hypothetical protein